MKMIVLVLCSVLLVVGCGRNNGSPNPPPAEKEEDGKKKEVDPPPAPKGPAPIDLTLTSSAKDGHWRAAIEWEIGPKRGSQQPIENKFKLKFVDDKGLPLNDISGVVVTAWMPTHGHDTGSRKPKAVLGEGGVVNVDYLFFSMTGSWELVIKATRNGVEDELRVSLDIKKE